MSEIKASPLSRPTLLASEPQLFVRDVAAPARFYVEKLGFAVRFAYGEPPFYGQVFRDGAALNLRLAPSPVLDPRRRDSEELLSATIAVDDAKPLFLEFQASGVGFHHGLKTEPWGARTFMVRDLDGNLILFSGRGEKANGGRACAGLSKKYRCDRF